MEKERKRRRKRREEEEEEEERKKFGHLQLSDLVFLHIKSTDSKSELEVTGDSCTALLWLL